MIDIQKLNKRFGKLPVLQDLSLNIQTGSITAILGHNACGKTTLIKSILGLVKPDSGIISIEGNAINGEPQYRERIGYMPQIARFPENLTVAEIIAMIKDVRGTAAQLDEELFINFDLQKEMDKPIRTLSGGTRQKVSACIAFLFRPALLILDEPTAGLDPLSSSRLKDKIRREKQRGCTILLTCHVMSEVEELADRLVFLQEGRILFDDHIDQLINNSGEQKLERVIARMMQGEVL